MNSVVPRLAWQSTKDRNICVVGSKYWQCNVTISIITILSCKPSNEMFPIMIWSAYIEKWNLITNFRNEVLDFITHFFPHSTSCRPRMIFFHAEQALNQNNGGNICACMHCTSKMVINLNIIFPNKNMPDYSFEISEPKSVDAKRTVVFFDKKFFTL